MNATPDPSSLALKVSVVGVRRQPVPAPLTVVTGGAMSTTGGGLPESVSASAVAPETPQP